MANSYVSTTAHEKSSRLFKVAQLRLAGMTNQQRIASILGCSQATVSADFAELDSMWLASAVQDIAVAKGIELERIERLISELWLKALAGNLSAVDRIIKLMERKSRLLNLDAPITTNLVGAEAKRLAAEFGLDAAEIMEEVQRILRSQVPLSEGE